MVKDLLGVMENHEGVAGQAVEWSGVEQDHVVIKWLYGWVVC